MSRDYDPNDFSRYKEISSFEEILGELTKMITGATRDSNQIVFIPEKVPPGTTIH